MCEQFIIIVFFVGDGNWSTQKIPNAHSVSLSNETIFFMISILLLVIFLLNIYNSFGIFSVLRIMRLEGYLVTLFYLDTFVKFHCMNHKQKSYLSVKEYGKLLIKFNKVRKVLIHFPSR